MRHGNIFRRPTCYPRRPIPVPSVEEDTLLLGPYALFSPQHLISLPRYHPIRLERGELRKTLPELRLDSIPGIGIKSAAQLLAELPQIESFQIAAFAGLTPRHHQSGTSGKKRTPLCKIGSGRLRLILFFPALAAMRFSPHGKAFTQRLLDRGKPKLVIVGALMRKLIHIVFGVLKHHQPFNPTLFEST